MAAKLDWNIRVIELLTLISVVVGGGIGFFWVDQQQAELSSSQKTLTEIKTQLEEIKFQYAELNAAMESQNRQLTAQLTLADFVTDIQPRPNISLPSHITNKGRNSYAIELRIENKGRFPVFTAVPRVSLFHTSTDGVNIELENGKDFELVAPSEPGMIQPTETVISTINIALHDNQKAGKYILVVYFYNELNWAVRQVAKNTLSDFLNTEDIDKLVKTERTIRIRFEKHN